IQPLMQNRIVASRSIPCQNPPLWGYRGEKPLAAIAIAVKLDHVVAPSRPGNNRRPLGVRRFRFSSVSSTSEREYQLSCEPVSDQVRTAAPHDIGPYLQSGHRRRDGARG